MKALQLKMPDQAYQKLSVLAAHDAQAVDEFAARKLEEFLLAVECGGLTPLWLSGSSGFGMSSTLTTAMESAVEPAHSKGL